MNIHTNHHVQSSEFMTDHVSYLRDQRLGVLRSPITPTSPFPPTDEPVHSPVSSKVAQLQIDQDEMLARQIQQELNEEAEYETSNTMYSPDMDHENARVPNRIEDEENDEEEDGEISHGIHHAKPLVQKRRTPSFFKKLVNFMLE